jgi:hypothetical protein
VERVNILKEEIPSPLRGEGESPAPRGVQGFALNLTWFRGGGDLEDYFTPSGERGK